jgi:hypothetical protein
MTDTRWYLRRGKFPGWVEIHLAERGGLQRGLRWTFFGTMDMAMRAYWLVQIADAREHFARMIAQADAPPTRLYDPMEADGPR